MPQLTHHNSEINWRTGEVKMTRYLEECGKQQRLKQGKSGWKKQKEEEEKREEERKNQEQKEQKKEKEEKTKEEKDNGSKEDSREMGNME